MKEQNKVVSDFIKQSDGLLKLRPAFVAHTFLPPGKRLGLKEEEYNAGERGFYIERWFCSETHAVHEEDVPGEGISHLEIPGEDILLTDALATNGAEILGKAYAEKHGCLDRLVKIYDFGTRLFMHIHQKAEALAGTGKNPKDEAYHFLDAPMGPHPESFFGVQRFLVENNLQYDYFLPFLQAWEGGEEEILKYSSAYVNVPGEGFFLDSGILHAPGSALTMEIQESSDVGAIFQPVVSGHKIPKNMLLKDVPQEEVEQYGELAALRQVDWEASSDPEFFKKRHLFPHKVEDTAQGDVYEEWIYYGTPKFSGKRLLLKPGQTFQSIEPGVHNLFIWHGQAAIDGVAMRAGSANLQHCDDELLVTHERAKRGYTIRNTGDENVALYKFFGPEIHMNTPKMGY